MMPLVLRVAAQPMRSVRIAESLFARRTLNAANCVPLSFANPAWHSISRNKRRPPTQTAKLRQTRKAPSPHGKKTQHWDRGYSFAVRRPGNSRWL